MTGRTVGSNERAKANGPTVKKKLSTAKKMHRATSDEPFVHPTYFHILQTTDETLQDKLDKKQEYKYEYS